MKPGRPVTPRFVPVEVRADVRRWTGRCEPGDLGYDAVAPSRNPGERTGPPDFVVFGGPEERGGWWTSCIAEHPAVTPARTVHEASHAFARYGTRPFGQRDVDAFHEHFPRPPGTVVGHWSPDGLVYPWETVLLARAAPRARLVVIVRDPVERLRAGLAGADLHRGAHIGSALADVVDRGYHAEHLRRLLGLFAAEQVLVVQHERAVVEVDATLRRIWTFLGADGIHGPSLTAPPPEPDPGPIDAGVRDRLVELYASDVRALAALVPDLDLALWPDFAAAG